MTQLAEYLDRITSRYRHKPKYLAMMALLLQPFVDVQELQAQLGSYYFDIDTAVGVQLDAVGVRVGLKRDVEVPIVGIYFSWDDVLRGWDRGVWKGPYGNEFGVVRLDDDTYRRLLYTKARANAWDGTVEEAQSILDEFFDDPAVFAMYVENLQSARPSYYLTWDAPDAQEGWDVGAWRRPGDADVSFLSASPSVTIAVSGKLPPLVLMYLLVQNVVPLKPNGVALEYSFTSVNETPMFGFDVENDRISGWDVGSWGVGADYIAENVAVGSS